jgi:hypothetical protein
VSKTTQADYHWSVREAYWHLYGGRHTPPCVMCEEAEAFLAGPKVSIDNALVKMVRALQSKAQETR